MNRRTFITASVAASTLSSAMGRAVAQDAPNLELSWDETSQLFGNAWDLLPQAEEGTVQLLNVSIGPPSLFGTRLYGVSTTRRNHRRCCRASKQRKAILS